MNNVKLKEGAVIGYAVVAESDNYIDPFGNVQPGSKPIVLETDLNNDLYRSREIASRTSRHGRRVICKLVVVEEVD